MSNTTPAAPRSGKLRRVFRINGLSVHDGPEWTFRITGIRTPAALPNAHHDASQTLSPMAVVQSNTTTGIIETELVSAVRLRLRPDVDGIALQRMQAALAGP